MSTAQTISQEAVTLNIAELEAIIRRIVREEVTQAFEAWRLYEEPTVIEAGSPIHEDMVELLRMKEAGTLKLLSHKKVWGDDDDLSG